MDNSYFNIGVAYLIMFLVLLIVALVGYFIDKDKSVFEDLFKWGFIFLVAYVSI